MSAARAEAVMLPPSPRGSRGAALHPARGKKGPSRPTPPAAESDARRAAGRLFHRHSGGPTEAKGIGPRAPVARSRAGTAGAAEFARGRGGKISSTSESVGELDTILVDRHHARRVARTPPGGRPAPAGLGDRLRAGQPSTAPLTGGGSSVNEPSESARPGGTGHGPPRTHAGLSRGSCDACDRKPGSRRAIGRCQRGRRHGVDGRMSVPETLSTGPPLEAICASGRRTQARSDPRVLARRLFASQL